MSPTPSTPVIIELQINVPPGEHVPSGLPPAGGSRRRDQFEACSRNNVHESNLFAGRMNTLVTSQSLFVLGTAITSANGVVGDSGRWWAMFLIACVALASTVFMTVALRIGCRIWSRWLEQQQELVDDDRTTGGELTGLVLSGRRLPDGDHRWAVDYPAYVTCALFLLLWAGMIAVLLIDRRSPIT